MKNKKILLVNPPYYRFFGREQDYVPLSLLAVGSKLKENGNEILAKNLEIGSNLSYCGYSDIFLNYDRYLDGIEDSSHFIWKEFINLLDRENPDVVGVTVLNAKYRSAKKILDIASNLGIECMVGGMHPTINPQMYNGSVVCIGEFENNPYRVMDLDDLPFPDYDIFIDNYSPNGYGHLTMTRGCPFNCRFCASRLMWKKKVTSKSVDRLLNEMRYVHNRFGTSLFTFWDESFLTFRKKAVEFCEKFNLDADWCCDARADSIDFDLVKLMVKSRCIQIGIGIESGSNRILKYIGKEETIDDFKVASNIFNKIGIKWKAYCIFGFPEETESEMIQTLEFIKSLQPFKIVMSIFTPYQGTSLYDECVEDKNILEKSAHQSPYNFFSKTITKDRFGILMYELASRVDEYNKERK